MFESFFFFLLFIMMYTQDEHLHCAKGQSTFYYSFVNQFNDDKVIEKEKYKKKTLFLCLLNWIAQC
jgi:hypothetical protein